MTQSTPNALADDLVEFIRTEATTTLDADLDADTDLVMSGLVDSLGVVLIVEFIEQRLNVRIDPGDVVIEHFISVSAMIDYLGTRDDCSIVTAT